MSRALFLLICLGAWLVPSSQAARRALVIGNSAYRAPLTPLPQAASTADEVGGALGKLGFEVTVRKDLTLQALSETLKSFAAALKADDAALVYYTGQGLQGPNDHKNWLLPVDFTPAEEMDLALAAFSLTNLIYQMEQTKAAPRIVIVDAAYQNAALEKIFRTEGLAGVETDDLHNETEVMLSAAPDKLISRDAGSLFAHSLIAAWSKPGSSLTAVYDYVQRAMLSASGQTPARVPKVLRDFYFVDPPPPPKPVIVTETMKTGVPRTNAIDGMDYMWIPPGRFKLGCVPADRKCEDDEKPQHEMVMANGFWMTRTEVTAQAYRRFANATKRPLPKTLYNPKMELQALPQQKVSWEDAGAYCQWAGGRLPSEVEWEYAARGGKADLIFPWGNEMDRDLANSFLKKYDKWDEIAPVREYPPNGYGLFDVAGNVWEWTGDVFDPDAYKPAGAPGAPPKARKKTEMILRGGGFSDGPDMLRVSKRGHLPPEGGSAVGMRCVIEDAVFKY